MDERYNRHNLIDWFSQEKLHSLTVGVVGCGAIGNEVAKNLTLLGVGKIVLFDFDTIEKHNLTRSVLFRDSDVGQSKVHVAAQRVRELDPNVTVVEYEGDFWDTLPIKELAFFDVVICCVDNFEARIRLNQLCMVASVDLVNTAIDSRFAVCEIYPFSKGDDSACYEYTLPDSVYQRESERYSCGWLKKVSFETRTIPTTVVTSSMAGALATSTALRLGDGDDNSTARRVLLDSITGVSSVSEITRNKACFSCSSRDNKAIYLTSSRTIDETLTGSLDISNSELYLQTSDPILTSHYCENCNNEHGDDVKQLSLASDYDSSLLVCKHCTTASVVVDIKDSFSVEELLQHHRGQIMPCKYLTLDADDIHFIIELED